MTKKTLRLFFWLSLATASGSCALISGFYLYLSPKLPEVETLRQVKLQTPLRIFSSEGLLIGEFGEKRRTPISFLDTPPDFINAILSAEDDRFYSHPGVDIKGLLRAASQLLQSGRIQTGGSTITMQVARNFFLTRNQTFSRKFNEILLALQIEDELSKEEILELYINKIYLGNRAYGIEAASQVYYGKTIKDLSLAQLAMIAGLPKAPSAYNPIVNPTRALVRRNWILGRMLHLGYIDPERYNQALLEPVSATYHGTPLDLKAPYIAEMARTEALEKLGRAAYTDGYRIHTTINAALQARAQEAVIQGLTTYDLRHGYRGAEQQLSLPDITDDNYDPLTNTHSAEYTQFTLDSWQASLKKVRNFANTRAAVVISTEEKALTILLADGSQSSVEWANGLSSARPYIDENRRGPSPKKAADIAAIGDVIRIKEVNNAWHLTQTPRVQAALVAISPKNGAINALAGGFDFYQSNFNRATQAARQPGSNFKPFIYTAALESGMTPATIINDAPIVFDDAGLEDTWRPENASGKFFGPTRLRQALYKSRNLVSIRVLRNTGIGNAIKGMERYHFNQSQMPRDLSLALGSYELTPMQVAVGYTVFANGGYKVDPYLIQSIDDADGNSVFKASPATVCRECEKRAEQEVQETSQLNELSALEQAMAAELGSELDLGTDTKLADTDEPEEALPVAPRVMSKQVAYLVDDMLRDVIKKGTGRKAKALGRHDLAGKTGTTNGPKDAWFSGYNAHMVTTTWVGFDQNTPLGRREYGGTAALPIWMDFMKLALDGVPEVQRELPENLVSVRIDSETGLRTGPNNPKAIFEIFRADKLPKFESQVDQGDDLERNLNETQPEDLF